MLAAYECDNNTLVDVIASIVRHNAHYSDVRKRILENDVFIIDECAMLSRPLFGSLNAVCKMKNLALLFGRIQLILCGDFTQLPPVPN